MYFRVLRLSEVTENGSLLRKQDDQGTVTKCQIKITFFRKEFDQNRSYLMDFPFIFHWDQ